MLGKRENFHNYGARRTDPSRYGAVPHCGIPSDPFIALRRHSAQGGAIHRAISDRLL